MIPAALLDGGFRVGDPLISDISEGEGGGVVRSSRGKGRRSHGSRGPVRREVACGEHGRCRRVEHDSESGLVAAMAEDGRVVR